MSFVRATEEENEFIRKCAAENLFNSVTVNILPFRSPNDI